MSKVIYKFNMVFTWEDPQTGQGTYEKLITNSLPAKYLDLFTINEIKEFYIKHRLYEPVSVTFYRHDDINKDDPLATFSYKKELHYIN